jgi:hypothetical protein
MAHRHNSIVLNIFETMTNPDFRPQNRHERAWADLGGNKPIKEVFHDWGDMSQFAIHRSVTGLADPALSQSHWMRPDILIERNGRKTLEIIEVACTFEDYNLSNIDRVYALKENKYASFVEHLVKSQTYEEVNLKVVVIGVPALRLPTTVTQPPQQWTSVRIPSRLLALCLPASIQWT